MPPVGTNELTFAGWLAEFTAIRAQRRKDEGEALLIASSDIEERQVDAEGRVRRCDLRFNSPTGRKLASGELKRPEVKEGRDPRNESLRADARRKALARGLPYYFTCNMSTVVLYAIANAPREADKEVADFNLAPITHSSQAAAYRDQLAERWSDFLDDLEQRLVAFGRTRPTVTTDDVIAIRNAIFAVASEALARAERRVKDHPDVAEDLRQEARRSFNFPAALEPRYPDKLREELSQMLRFGTFVVAQKLVLYRVLQDAGPRRGKPFKLDELVVPATSTDPQAVRAVLDRAFSLAMRRSRDYETAFEPEPFVDLLFTDPEGVAETRDCEVGSVWHHLLEAVKTVSWLSISQNIVGLLYEVIVEERFRHQLGQFYTPEDVVDLLTTFALRRPGELVLDPTSGGGSFLRAAYHRKRALGETHESALETTWGCELTQFAAELSTVTLATSDPNEAAAYPRVLLTDFFALRPGSETELLIPDRQGRLRVPDRFDAVIGNPPYISYRRLTNQDQIINALAAAPDEISFPKFSGKSDAYVWMIVHATRFLPQGGRLSFVVSSALLFSDYGVPLIRFIGGHYRVRAVIDSMVERWFPDADTNTVLLFLERESDPIARSENVIRFVRLRRPLAQLLPGPGHVDRRARLEDLVDTITDAVAGDDDPRMRVNTCVQGLHGGLALEEEAAGEDLLEDEDDE